MLLMVHERSEADTQNSQIEENFHWNSKFPISLIANSMNMYATCHTIIIIIWTKTRLN